MKCPLKISDQPSGPRGLGFESRHSDQKQLELLLRNVDETHLLYGSDMPYTNLSACFGQMEALENTQKLTEHQKQLMFTDTEPIMADTKSEQHAPPQLRLRGFYLLAKSSAPEKISAYFVNFCRQTGGAIL